MTENSFNIRTLIMLSICAAGTPRSVCGYAFITGTMSPQEEAFPSNGVLAASLQTSPVECVVGTVMIITPSEVTAVLI